MANSGIIIPIQENRYLPTSVYNMGVGRKLSMWFKVANEWAVMLTRPKPYEAVTPEAEAKTHEAEAKTHEAEAKTHEADRD